MTPTARCVEALGKLSEPTGGGTTKRGRHPEKRKSI